MARARSARVTEGFAPVVVHNPKGAAPLVLVCEHASNALPARFGDLGIDGAVQDSHVAWDPGAAPVAERLSRLLDAPLVAGGLSRLVYDLNRPPEAPDAVAAVSEVHAIPGNRGLGADARAERVRLVYRPFAERLDGVLAARPGAAVVTVHTFTPVYAGKARSVRIGVLHDEDARLADALIALSGSFLPWQAERNAPYGPADRVTTTLVNHALPAGRLNAMLEIRNDLVATPADQRAMADRIAAWVRAALSRHGLALPEAA